MQLNLEQLNEFSEKSFSTRGSRKSKNRKEEPRRDPKSTNIQAQFQYIVSISDSSSSALVISLYKILNLLPVERTKQRKTFLIGKVMLIATVENNVAKYILQMIPPTKK